MSSSIYIFWFLSSNLAMAGSITQGSDPVHLVPASTKIMLESSIKRKIGTQVTYLQDGEQVFSKSEINLEEPWCEIQFRAIARKSGYFSDPMIIKSSRGMTWTSYRDADYVSLIEIEDGDVGSIKCEDGINRDLGFVSLDEFQFRIASRILTFVISEN